MSIASIQSQYPNALWFDSNDVASTNAGTLDNPYTSWASVISGAVDSDVVAVKDGSHAITSFSEQLTIVGESLDAILTVATEVELQSTTGVTFNDLSIESNISSSSCVLEVQNGTYTFNRCKLQVNNYAIRGFFRSIVDNGTATVTLNECLLKVGGASTTHGAILGMAGFNDGVKFINMTNCTSVITGGSCNRFITNFQATGQVVFKNNIFTGTGSETIGATLTTDTNNCYHQTSHSGGTNNIFADPQFVDSANDDYRLRPSSPCIGAGTAS